MGEYDIVVPMDRYDELVRTESKYELITGLIKKAYTYNDIMNIIKTFGLEEKQENAE